MTFTARYRAREVLIAITGAAAIPHLARSGSGLIGTSFEDYQDQGDDRDGLAKRLQSRRGDLA